MLQQDFYQTVLRVIGEVTFTQREIDIIACVISGHSTKKAAAFLGISPKTVEHHIRSVTLKVGCRSQEGIIDFIERSDRFNEVREYYACFLLKKRSLSSDQNSLLMQKQYDSLLQSKTDNAPSSNKISTHSFLHAINYFWPKKLHWSIISIAIFFVFACISLMAYKNSFKDFFSIFDSTLNIKNNALPLTWNIPRQDNLFIGRKKLLQTIQQELNVSSSFYDKKMTKSDKKISWVVFTGLGGVGKTQLALNYIQKSKVPYTVRAWFYSENSEALKSQYIDFAKTLGINGREPSFEDAKTYVNQWLKQNPGWLLVYDNAANYEDIKNYLPDQGGNIIITTRNQVWPNTFKVIDIDIMSEAEAIELISSLLKHHNTLDQEGAAMQELVKKLGYLPLALAQAAAFIDQSSIRISNYLQLYKTHEQLLLQEDAKPIGTDHLPVAATWNISLRAIANEAKNFQSSSNPLNLLMLCAYLAPERIPKQMLLTWISEKYPGQNAEILLAKFINKLRQYSMITINDNESITIHRLVQSVLREQHQYLPENLKQLIETPTVEWFNGMFRAFNKVLLIKNHIIEVEQRMLQLLPHLQTFINHYDELWPNQSSLELGKILYNVAHILRFYLGETQLSKNYYTRALSIQRKYYIKDNIEIAKTLVGLGNVYRESGDHELAKKLLTEALYIVENQGEKGLQQIEIPRILHNLASVHRRSGDPLTAKVLLERALKLCEANPHTTLAGLAGEHIEVSLILTKLGNVYVDLGNTKKAKEILKQAIMTGQEHYGKNHIWVSDPMHSLGNTYLSEGHYQEACKILEEIFKIRENYYGKDHRWVGILLTNLGHCYAKMGNTKQGIQLLERALEIVKKSYGDHYIRVSLAQKHLAEAYLLSGNYPLAKKLLLQALSTEEKYYTSNFSEIANTLLLISELYLKLGDLEQAKHFFERAVAIKRKLYDENSPELGKALLVQLKIQLQMKDKASARALALKCYQIFLEAYGNNSAFTKEAFQFLGPLV